MDVEVIRAFHQALATIKLTGNQAAVDVIDLVLRSSRQAQASDVHLQPTPEGLEMRWRIDGVLHLVTVFPAALCSTAVARLKVLSGLLTYRSDVPQEGRIRVEGSEGEVRVSTFPTLHGEKAVVRVFANTGRFASLGDLGLPSEVLEGLTSALGETSGAILLTGPSGSGKTTTIYACLRALVTSSHGARSLATLEDPVEGVLPGVTQSQINLAAGFDLATGLRSLLRQDPEVIAVGEIRDPSTAEVAFQASLTGHLVLSTFHAGSASGAVARLLDMGIEPYLLRSGLLAVVSQRLVRLLCDCSVPETDPRNYLGLRVESACKAVGCPACSGSGYRGRMVIAELLLPEQQGLAPLILRRADLQTIEAEAIRAGMIGRWQRALAAVEEGRTSPAEVRRVLGFADAPGVAS